MSGSREAAAEAIDATVLVQPKLHAHFNLVAAREVCVVIESAAQRHHHLREKSNMIKLFVPAGLVLASLRPARTSPRTTITTTTDPSSARP